MLKAALNHKQTNKKYYYNVRIAFVDAGFTLYVVRSHRSTTQMTTVLVKLKSVTFDGSFVHFPYHHLFAGVPRPSPEPCLQAVEEDHLPAEFRKRLTEWEIAKALAGKSQQNVEQLQKHLPSEFNKKYEEWRLKMKMAEVKPGHVTPSQGQVGKLGKLKEKVGHVFSLELDHHHSPGVAPTLSNRTKMLLDICLKETVHLPSM